MDALTLLAILSIQSKSEVSDIQEDAMTAADTNANLAIVHGLFRFLKMMTTTIRIMNMINARR